ncbi:DUF1214 domain-containing protein [Rhodococcus pyridinivorans]|uniref:DUF1214 domain-containing protein n=1 Tax=Rhodococcus pyridinivorans TaxID=103816 RepID=A0A7M2XLF1_9NOCA|nr:DUF1214 domain-containing protein [Rhodococcus pyridinivorans]QOV98182.1 DUF1214 domain-containing protein [Rhodococcus pyridinivorans]
MAVHVNVDNFVRAETDRMFADLQRDAGGVNLLLHNREPAAIDRQTVIRLNRDTLYSFAVVDVSEGATLTLPEHGDRYVSAMVLDRDHFVRAIHHEAGSHRLDAESPHVVVAVRTLADPADPDDLKAAAAIQNGIRIDAASARPFTAPEYDTASLDATRTALLRLASGLTGFDSTFGRPDEVDPVRHLIGTAAGWGGLPSSEASYIGVAPQLPPGNYELTLDDVPVDGFWSVSVYDADGFFAPNPREAYSVNNITGKPNEDGSVTVRFGDFPEGTPNAIPTPEGWNFLVRLYRPRAAIIDGSWTLPELTPAR